MSIAAPNFLSEFASTFSDLGLPWRVSGVNRAETVWVNDELAGQFGIDPLLIAERPEIFLEPSESSRAKPFAQVYAGHQFGNYSPRLGDGRAVLLGELRDRSKKLYDVHLKGSGPTPFSREGDGYAPLQAMLREALMGEAMHGLGIKTSRILAVISTGRWIARDGEPQPAAIAVRVAESHLRVGTFQFVRATGDTETLANLVTYALGRHYPDSLAEGAAAPGGSPVPESSPVPEGSPMPESSPAPESTAVPENAVGAGSVEGAESQALRLLKNVVTAQAKLVADWMLTGFVHGVINTDNVTISGETLDYGPCAMLDYYESNAVFSSIDHAGRYAFQNQPPVMQWNMARFAESLLPLIAPEQDDAVAIATREVQNFMPQYEEFYNSGLTKKLAGADPEAMRELTTEKADFTQFFRKFSAANPVYIARNHLVSEALEKAEAADFSVFNTLIKLLRDPTKEISGYERFAEPPARSQAKIITTCGT